MKTASNSQKTAISYTRFSSEKQKDGDSEKRQNDAFDYFCRSHNLTPGERYIDRGLSAYHGRHKTEGALGKILAMIQEKKIVAGTTLVVENWDRFDRSRPDKALATLVEILEAGVQVGVVSLDMLVTEEHLDTPTMQWIHGDMVRARQESKRKAELSRRNVARLREQQKSGERKTWQCPVWLDLIDVATGKKAPPRFKGATRYEFNENADYIRKATKLAIDGHGVYSIAAKLGVKFPGLAVMLRSISLMGLFQPHKRTGKSVSHKEKHGEAFMLYPALLDEGTFNRLQNAIDSRRNKAGRKGPTVTNLFAGIIFDGDTHTKLSIRHHGRRYFGLDKRIHKESVWVRYELVEKAILQFLEELTPSSLSPADDATAQEIERLEGILAKTKRDAKQVMESGASGSFVVEYLEKLENEKLQTQTTLDTLKRQAVSSQRDTLATAKTVMEALENTPVDQLPVVRRKLQDLIRGIVRQIDLYPDTATEFGVVVKLVSGVNKYISFRKERLLSVKDWSERPDGRCSLRAKELPAVA